MSQDLIPPSQPHAVVSPQLDLSETADTKVWDTLYPPANRVDEVDVLDDWLEAVDQALTDSRNGVTAISWPLALASLLAAVALVADAVDSVGFSALSTPAGWWSLASSSPLRLTASTALGVFAVAAWKLTSDGTHARKKLTQLRASYLRRRREMSASATE